MRAKNKWMWWGLLGLATSLKGYRQRFGELAQIQGAIYYLKAIRAVREVYVSIFQVLICLVFFVAGLILLHIAAILFFSYGPHAKAGVMFALGLIELSAASGFAMWFFSAKRWFAKAESSKSAYEKCRVNKSSAEG